MIITPEKRAEMLEVAKPLIKWLNENCHPHCHAIVECDRILLMDGIEGIASNKTDEFCKD
jgi:hypothetical protein